MAATVSRHPEDEEEAAAPDLIVPPSAVFTAEAGQGSYVWVVGADKKVARKAVKTGKLTPVGLVVTEGLKPGDLVVTAGVHSLREGQEVKLLEEGSR